MVGMSRAHPLNRHSSSPPHLLPIPLPLKEQGERLLFALERLEEILLLCLRRAGGKEQLSLIQAQILLQVARNLEPIRLTELHRTLGVSKASLSKTVNRLVAKRYLKIVRTPGDRRSRWLSLTPKGLSLLGRIQGELTPLLRLMERYGTRYPEYYRITLEILREAQALGLIPEQRMCLTCAYYEGKEQGQGYCHFLRIPLTPGDLRILCPDHRVAAGASG